MHSLAFYVSLRCANSTHLTILVVFVVVVIGPNGVHGLLLAPYPGITPSGAQAL